MADGYISQIKTPDNKVYLLKDSEKLALTGGTLTGGLEIKGHIAGDTDTTGHGLWGGGAYHNAYNNIILHGDTTSGSSGIAFISDKGATTINQPSDRAFIQYHAYGVTTYTAEGTNPTLATSGEANVLVIGVGNDGNDTLRLQTPGRTGLLHQVAAASYVIPDTGNTTGSVGGTTTPVYAEAGVIKAGTALKDLAYIAKPTSNTTTTFLRGDGTWQTALTAHQSLEGYKTRQVKSKSLTSAGWYRILDCTAYSMAFFITFYGSYNNQPPTPVTFLVSHAYNTTKIEQIGRSANIGWIQELRAIHHDTSKFYIDVYYAGAKGNIGAFEITPLDPNARSSITLINFTAITDSVTANASCTTSLESHADKAEDTNTINGLTVETAVPANAIFTDHYAWGDITSKPDTATRWPKWNEIAAGADALAEGTSAWTDNTEILTSYASNNGFADTNAKGVVYRRDAISAYNYIKGKLDSVYVAKSAGVTNVAWDSTNKKITKTINGTTSDVVTAATLKAAINVTAEDLGLSNALHFIGITSTELSNGSTTTTLTPKTSSPSSLIKTTGFVDGDVVMDGDQLREYVWSGNAWRLLGITTSTAYTQPASTATNTWIAQISQGTDGKITATTGSLNTSGTWSGTASKATTTANTTDALYLVGVKSGATSTLLHDTSITVKGNTLDAGIIKLHQGTAADPSLTGNARIEFDYSNGQPVVISYTPNDGYRAPAGLKIMGGTSATPAWLEVEGNIYAAAFKGNADTATTATNLSAAPSITSGGTATVTLSANTAYTLTVGGKSVIFKTPVDNNTATAVDNILDGSNSGTAITYAPYAAKQDKLSFDTSTTAPDRTDRLNLNGFLYATQYNVAGQVTLQWNATDSSLDFVFA